MFFVELISFELYVYTFLPDLVNTYFFIFIKG